MFHQYTLLCLGPNIQHLIIKEVKKLCSQDIMHEKLRQDER